MADLLRAAATLPAFRRALRLYLVEASPVLRAEQQRRLAAAEPQFVDSVEALPSGPLLVVANEFLDALPIRQLVRGHSQWAERLVGLDGEGRLAFVEGPESPALILLVPDARREAPPGTIVEICPAAAALAATRRRAIRPLTRRRTVCRLRLFPEQVWPNLERPAPAPAGRRAPRSRQRRS